MKKLICMFLCVVLCLSCVPASFAENWVQYEIPELSMELYFPESYYVWDLNLKQDDPILENLGVGYDYLMNVLRISNGYLNAISKDQSTEVMIGSVDSPNVSDLGLLQKDIMNFKISARKEQIESDFENVVITSYDFFPHRQATFVKYYYEQKIDDDTVYYGTKYYTVYNNKEIEIQVTSYTGALNEIQEKTMDGIVSSIVFEDVTSVADHPETLYVDKETGLEFTVPQGFEERELTEAQKESVTAAFQNKYGEILSFTSTDYYADLPVSEQLLKSRNLMGIDDMKQKDIDDMVTAIGATSDQLVRVRKGEYQFYEFTTNLTRDSISMKARADFTLINGYLYLFMCTALQNSESTAMDQLLSSVRAGDFKLTFDSLMPEKDEQDNPPEEEVQVDGADLREHLYSTYNAGAEGKNAAGDFFYYVYNADEGNAAILVIVSADRENYNGWEGTAETVGDHVVLFSNNGEEVPFYFSAVDERGKFRMKFINDGDVAMMHDVKFDTLVDDVVAARLEFVGVD